ncbi:uncharacterized protein LOC115629470 [Scaptodrosophila lebanonensis]|uniref:Uncharacterized protein LOC115629470 n=1 Tax=Drosophila lebanonensis TaxID=7225 RepID=A0A6J2TZ81_DROLE|nr:uncharacterized protein LOC115629470 [Scaptodrosophila lebanonensis]
MTCINGNVNKHSQLNPAAKVFVYKARHIAIEDTSNSESAHCSSRRISNRSERMDNTEVQNEQPNQNLPWDIGGYGGLQEQHPIGFGLWVPYISHMVAWPPAMHVNPTAQQWLLPSQAFHGTPNPVQQPAGSWQLPAVVPISYGYAQTPNNDIQSTSEISWQSEKKGNQNRSYGSGGFCEGVQDQQPRQYGPGARRGRQANHNRRNFHRSQSQPIHKVNSMPPWMSRQGAHIKKDMKPRAGNMQRPMQHSMSHSGQKCDTSAVPNKCDRALDWRANQLFRIMVEQKDPLTYAQIVQLLATRLQRTEQEIKRYAPSMLYEAVACGFLKKRSNRFMILSHTERRQLMRMQQRRAERLQNVDRSIFPSAR